MDGYGPHEGRLEIYYDGEWGTVCDDLFDTVNAEVACRQLGYYGGMVPGVGSFPQGTGPILLDSVVCIGNETELGYCAHDCWGCNDCSHGEDVGVICSMYCAYRS